VECGERASFFVSDKLGGAIFIVSMAVSTFSDSRRKRFSWESLMFALNDTWASADFSHAFCVFSILSSAVFYSYWARQTTHHVNWHLYGVGVVGGWEGKVRLRAPVLAAVICDPSV
jgi:hypothetical protein